jgi:catechol 2,3-dioxygenase-like lactoylglutathione lyase family enzyme
MSIQHISAVTLAVRDMAQAVAFYRKLGLALLYGGEEATFSSFRVGDGYLNLILAPTHTPGWWGRVIFRVDRADAIYQQLLAQGLKPEAPRNGAWGERYFHLTDPDGHELSFAELLPR